MLNLFNNKSLAYRSFNMHFVFNIFLNVEQVFAYK